MVRSRLGALVVVLVCANGARADAQSFFTGLLTGYIGVARDGDIGDAARTGGASIAVIDDNGVGAEIDVGYTGSFDEDFFDDASVASFMLNFIGIYSEGAFRPYVNLGVGAVHLRTSLFPGQPTSTQTEPAWDAGGGLFVVLNEYVSLRGDVRYFRLWERPTELVLRDPGFFDYWRLSIGATFTWPMR